MFELQLFDEPEIEFLLRLLAAVVVGGMIGMDRAYRGRAAGFRTHILVCMASSMLMILMDYHLHVQALNVDVVRIDPSRMAQGIMTGIGFLGAGVIMQDKQSVRGLTTAASIWITATIGIVLGAGYYLAAFFGALLTLVTLAIFNRLIDVLPMRRYAYLNIRFLREDAWGEVATVDFLRQFQLSVSSMSYKLEAKGRSVSYQMTVRSTRIKAFHQVAESMLQAKDIQEFSVRPLGD